MFEDWDTFAWATVILTCLAIIVPSVIAVVLWRRQVKRDEESRKEKRFGYRIDYAQSLVSLTERVDAGDIEVLFKGKKLAKPEIMGVTFKNIGQVAILKDDFSEPLKLVFGEGAEIISVDVEDKSKSDLPVAFKVEGAEIGIEKLLLNAGDSFSLKVLGTKVSEFATSAHIRDVVELEDINEAMERERADELARQERAMLLPRVATLAVGTFVAARLVAAAFRVDFGGVAVRLAIAASAFSFTIFIAASAFHTLDTFLQGAKTKNHLG